MSSKEAVLILPNGEKMSLSFTELPQLHDRVKLVSGKYYVVQSRTYDVVRGHYYLEMGEVSQ